MLAFIEGGAVMCIELCSAKILTPYFGTSIYIWAAVLGTTLTALMSGYYLGGYISSKSRKETTIFWLMLAGGILLTLTPLISKWVLPVTIQFSLATGSILSLISFLFFPLLTFGATSPLLINLLTEQAKDSGKSSGTVYSVSTLGGIITTFVIGFYTLPEFGITKTLYGYGILVMGYTTYLFIVKKQFKTPISLLIITAAMSYNFKSEINGEVIYRSEGILGEIKVVDRYLNNPAENRMIPYRMLVVNNISQTIMNLENPKESYWDYVDVLTYNLNSYTSDKKTLLMGLGGGTLYKKLEENNYKTDVVELDERIAEVSKDFFFIEPSTSIIVDDGRHYLNTTKQAYDVVIYDLFHAETPPSHIMTREAFGEVKNALSENGILAINFFGFINGSKGKAARSIYKTLLASGFQVRLYATPGEEQNRNLLFICSRQELKAKNDIIHPLLYEMDIDLNDAELLTDDRPNMEHLYLEAALAWRTDYNEFNTKYFLNK
ncbi:MAG: fused MFS/spermidine synthase [Flavobacteriales bacterium]|nr:fused MFS/spermidine synthase [Flavobacteriales bacterium]